MQKRTFVTQGYWVAIGSVIVVFLFVVSGNPILTGIYAAHDDALFFRGLENILIRDWLGQYDNRTLAKGPMLSLIGALSATLGVPAKIAEAVIYLFAGGALLLLTRRVGLHAAAATALFILILCNPHLWSRSGSRYLRDILYASFVLFAVVFATGTVFLPQERVGRWCAAGTGFFTGCAYLTREEDIWIIVTIATIFAVAALLNFLRKGVLCTLGAWRLVIQMASIGVVALAAVVSPVMLANRAIYGSAIVSEFRSSEFRAAMGALARVGDIHPSGFVSVPQSSLEAVFQAAPVTESIRDHWPNVLTQWDQFGAHLIPEYSGEIAGGWFAWAFRDAVAAAGHHSSASAARDFYAQLAKEVNAACDEGTLICRRKRASLAPELTAERIPELIAASWNALLYTASMRSDAVTAARSEGETSTLMRWNQLIGPVVVGTSSEYLLSGWVVHMNGPLSIAPVTDSPIQIRDLSTETGTDVITHFEALGTKGVGAVRFSMVVNCLADGCAIAVTTGDGESQTIPLNEPARGMIPLDLPFVGYFDVVEQRAFAALSQRPLEGLRVALASGAVKLAQVAVPILSLIATIGMLAFLALCQRHRRSDWLFVLAAGAAAAVVVRCGIIAYIDITSWRAINVSYLGPAYPFMIIYSVAGTAILANIASDLLRGSQPSS